MSNLSAATLLAAWERALPQNPIERSLTLLAAAWPERSEGKWAEASVGERDGYLLRLREEVFGSELEATTVCPACGERLQLAFSTGAVRSQPPESSSAGGRFLVEAGGYELSCRLLTSADMIEVAGRPDDEPREVLLRCCVTARRRGGEAVDPASLPEEVVSAVTERMAQADPQAEVQIELTCPACAHRWSTVFDIISYLWGEVDDWAHRLLLEVHALASAYGWSERDIIAMSARRRSLYLEMVGD